MLPTLNEIFLWLSHYKYIVIFPLAIVEGPILAVIAGFLSSINQLNFVIAYLLLVIADTIGDIALYLMGKFGNGKIPSRLLEFIGINQSRVISMEKILRKHPKRIFLVGKSLHGVGGVILFTAGYVSFPFDKYLIYNVAMTTVKSFLLMIIGYYFGKAYSNINQYFDYWAIVSAVIFIGFYVVFLSYTQKLADEGMEKN